MNATFENAPLVEIIAEIRWNPQPSHLQVAMGHGTAATPVMALNTNSFEEFFMRFGGEVYQQGFELSERLVPAGFPMMLFQPVYRYRKAAREDASVLYQVGAGIFSANAIPPYRSWDTFSPTVEAGVLALLKTRSHGGGEAVFSSVSLRYIDAFGPDLTEGRDIWSFFRDVLGIKLDLPAGLTDHAQPGESPKPSLQLVLPLENKMTMSVGIGDGMVNNEPAIVMDTTVATTADLHASRESVMDTLNSARDVIHRMFIDLTRPISSLMKPKA